MELSKTAYRDDVRNPSTTIAERGRGQAPAPLASPIAARLELISGARAVWIISPDPYSARLSMESPPAIGVSALLIWHAHEHFTTVSWVGEGECALKFDRQIGPAVPIARAAPRIDQPRAVAALDQMQTRKRRKALVLDLSTASDTVWEWVVRLGRRNAPIASAQSLTVEEEMFFYNAPLAHILEQRVAAGRRIGRF